MRVEIEEKIFVVDDFLAPLGVIETLQLGEFLGGKSRPAQSRSS